MWIIHPGRLLGHGVKPMFLFNPPSTTVGIWDHKVVLNLSQGELLSTKKPCIQLAKSRTVEVRQQS